MADDLSSLGEDELSRLVQVIETLERSEFDFIELELDGMKVALGKGDPAGYLRGSRPASASAPAPTTPRPDPVTEVPASAAGASPPAPESRAVEEGVVEIRAPMLGMFYAQPRPGEPPYVTVGSVVQPDTTVALLEVMKMFNAVPAGVEGTIEAVLVEDAQLVEYDQPLFRVRVA